MTSPHYLDESTEILPPSFLIFAPPGRGKTFWAGNSPRPALVSTGNGLATIKSPQFQKLAKESGTRPFLIPVQEEASVLNPTSFNGLRRAIDNALEHHSDKFDTLVLDDATFTNTSARSLAVVLNGNTGKSQTASQMASGMQREIILPTIADFGTEMNLVDTFFRELTQGALEYKKNLIVCAHDRTTYKKIKTPEGKTEEKIDKIMPLFVGRGAPDLISRMFDMVWYIKAIGTGDSTVREFVTDSESVFNCKTRWGGLFSNPERRLTAAEAIRRINHYQLTGEITKK